MAGLDDFPSSVLRDPILIEYNFDIVSFLSLLPDVSFQFESLFLFYFSKVSCIDYAKIKM